MNSTTEKQPRRTAPPETRRQQLIDATMAVIAEHGLSGTTTAMVTRRAGLSLGSVNQHFNSKDELLEAVLHNLAEELREKWSARQSDPSLSAAEKLSDIIQALFDPEICTPTKIAVWFAFFGDAGYRHAYRRLAGDFDINRADAIEELCYQIKSEGGYSDIDPCTVTQAIESVADGLWLSLLLYPDLLKHDEAIANIQNILSMHFPKHFPLS